jgi:hypothetical protein
MVVRCSNTFSSLAEPVHAGTWPPHPGGSPARQVGAEPARAPGKDSADRLTETLRCGCDVYPADLHDVDACLEALADELAYREELRRGDLWSRQRPCGMTRSRSTRPAPSGR